MASLTREFPEAKRQAAQPFDWDKSIVGVAEYQQRQREHVEGAQLNDWPDDWKSVTGERSRRIWEWWKLRRKDPKLPCFLRLVGVIDCFIMG